MQAASGFGGLWLSRKALATISGIWDKRQALDFFGRVLYFHWSTVLPVIQKMTASWLVGAASLWQEVFVLQSSLAAAPIISYRTASCHVMSYYVSSSQRITWWHRDMMSYEHIKSHYVDVDVSFFPFHVSSYPLQRLHLLLTQSFSQRMLEGLVPNSDEAHKQHLAPLHFSLPNSENQKYNSHVAVKPWWFL